MGYVLTNGTHYISRTETGAIRKVENIEDARVYLTTQKAKECMKKATKKTKGYYILDLESLDKYNVHHGRIHFPQEVRKMVYNTAEGRCVLCGRKICYDAMTLDHIKPLAFGGADSVENLQCTCKACNQFKGSVLPDNFMERVTAIFLYQMDKKMGKRMRWKIVHKLLKKVI